MSYKYKTYSLQSQEKAGVYIGKLIIIVYTIVQFNLWLEAGSRRAAGMPISLCRPGATDAQGVPVIIPPPHHRRGHDTKK